MAQAASRARTPQPGAPHAAEAAGERVVAPPPVDLWMRSTQVATVGLFILALLWSAHVSQPVLVPVLLGWVIATILLPIVQFLQQRKVPRVLAAILLGVALLAVILGVLSSLAAPASSWIGRATELRILLQEKFQMLSRPFAFLDEMKKTLSSITSSEPGTLKVEQESADVVTTTVGVVMPAAGQFVLFFGALLFYLVYRERIRTTVVMFFGGREARLGALRTLQSIEENMATYFSTYTIVNLFLGMITFALAYVTGLPNPLLWGFFAAVLNYIPYLGPGVVTVTLAVVGLLTFPSLASAAVAPLVYLAVVTVEGHFLTPYLMGRRLELNPFAVFLSIAFCVWLWGPVGAFLAVPLLMAVTVSVEHAFAETKPALPG